MKYLFEILFFFIIAYLLGLKFRLLGVLNINWDEFNFLSIVHQYLRGELQPTFQTFHAYLFFWLPSFSTNEVEQILVARKMFWIIRVINSLLLYKIARELTGKKAALYAVISTLAFSYVLRHGETFRYDLVISTLFLLGLYLLICLPKRTSFHIAAGTIFLLSLMISMKSVIYLPSLIFAYFYQIRVNRLHLMKTVLVLCISFLFLGLYFFLNPMWFNTFERMILLRFLDFPNFDKVLEQTLKWDWDFWIMLFCGFTLALWCLLNNKLIERKKVVTILGLFLPLLTISSYRNSWSYFYVSIVPSAAILSGFVITFLSGYLQKKQALFTMALFCLCLPPVIKAQRFYRFNSLDRIQHQKEVVDVVHTIFKKPTKYFDRASMIASFPSAAFFISTYTTALYRKKGIPQFRNYIQKKQPKFLINNSSAYNIASEKQPQTYWRLLPEDFKILQENFVQHWGPIWVAGKNFPAGSNNQIDFEILIPGTYTIISNAPITIDGKTVESGSLILLGIGFHHLKKNSSNVRATIKIGNHLYTPSFNYQGGKIFDGLSFRTSS